ncbi:MAG TPA: formyltransferase family protein, partial [Deltaproteobacteria bacterium]|nr:formyltransferase family protein [Deltaproteobacteria bacterium]
MIRIGVLVSGSGSNLQSIMDACAAGEIDGTVVMVISNVEGVYALERAERGGIPSRVISHADYPDREAFDAELAKALLECRVDLVCLAGFMR